MTDVAADPWMSSNVIFDILKCVHCSLQQHGVLWQRRVHAVQLLLVHCCAMLASMRSELTYDANVRGVLTCCRLLQ